MKKALTELKKALLLKYGDESLAFESYMKEVLKNTTTYGKSRRLFIFITMRKGGKSIKTNGSAKE